MDFSSQTVPQLRSLLTADGVAVPQGYLKKSELVDMCVSRFGRAGPPSRMSPVPRVRGRSSSESRRSSPSPEKPKSSRVSAARRKSSMGTKGNRPPSPGHEGTRSPIRTPVKPVDVSDIVDFRRTPSPEPGRGKTFSGRPSLAASGAGKKISIAPLSTLPPRPKSFGKKPVEQGRPWKTFVLVVSCLGAVALGFVYFSQQGSPRIPLCNTDGTPHVPKAVCSPCPKLGTCANGFLTSCVEHYVVHGDQCVRDEAKFVNAVAMVDSISSRLITLKGQKDCGDDVSDTVYPEQLRVMLRMEFKHLSDDQFRAAFDLALNGEKDGVVLPKHLITTPLGLMRSSFGKKSLSCQVQEFVHEWLVTILVVVLTSLYLGIKLTIWRRKRGLVRRLVAVIEAHTQYRDGRVQGLSVLDLRDKEMPLRHLEDKAARKAMHSLLKSHPDIQSGEELSRAGETVYWSAHRLRAEQSAHLKSSPPDATAWTKI